MGNTQSKIYVQNEHKALMEMENIENLEKYEAWNKCKTSLSLDAFPYRHREQRKDILFKFELLENCKMEREFEAENYWSILPKI